MEPSCDELSLAGDEDDEDLECKKLYLLVARCIAYPFNAKFQIESTPPRAKLNAERFRYLCRGLKAIVDNSEEVVWEYESRLTNQEQDIIKNADFVKCVGWMRNVVLERPDIVEICSNGGFSVKELESIFRVKATVVLGYGPEGVNSPEVALWCATFRKVSEQCGSGFIEGGLSRKTDGGLGGVTNSSGGVNPDKLYKVFQEILRVRSIEHQILYRECQVRARGRGRGLIHGLCWC